MDPDALIRSITPEQRLRRSSGRALAEVSLGHGPLLLTAQDVGDLLEGLKLPGGLNFELQMIQRSGSAWEPTSRLEVEVMEDGSAALDLHSVVWHSEEDQNNTLHIDGTRWPAEQLDILKGWLTDWYKQHEDSGNV